jgi:hypothetical protein
MNDYSAYNAIKIDSVGVGAGSEMGADLPPKD